MKKIDKREKVGPMKYLPKRSKKLIFYIRASIGNREAVEAKKKDFEHPRKEEEETMKENDRK